MRKLIILLVCSLALWSKSFAKVELRHYQAPMGEEQWRVTTSRLRCGLSIRVLDYGIAYFEQYATKDPHFIMTHWQRERQGIKARVWTYPPVWRPNLRPGFVTNTKIQNSEFAVFLRRKSALILLAGLAEGYMTRIDYRSELGFDVKVDLSPIHFKKSYQRYIRCVGNLLPFNYRDIQLTTLYFNSSMEELTDRDKFLLDRIRLYVSVDPRVKSVKIAGYSDNTGSRGVNNAISEARAKAVADYLLTKGLPERKLKVTWYGMLHPDDTNDTEIGRAKNRRVVIKVIK
jgi:outer membrane protein OmpA-like peptidoglycan-associated protein